MNLDVIKLFRDCCMFDLKQALTDFQNKFDNNMLDNECFSALTKNVEPKSAEIGQEQFYNWVRVQFPTLFYGLELWLRKISRLAKTHNESSEASAKVKNFY